jgi:hypothetical protein
MYYGTPDEVAALARIWADDGHWVDPVAEYEIRGTNPSLATVTQWLTTVSAQMNVALQASWFNVPADEIDNPDSYKAISQYVVALVADMAHVANGVQKDIPPIGKIMKDMNAWVEDMADGFLKDGMTQTVSPSAKNRTQFRVVGKL